MLTCQEAAAHALECPNSRMRCPMHTGVQGLRECQQDVTCNGLWQHCHDCHNTDDNRQVHMLVGKVVDLSISGGGVQSAALSVSVDLARNRAVFFIVQTSREAYRFCLHVCMGPDHVLHAAVRRFFPASVLNMRKILLGVEAGELCGLVTQWCEPLACHESITDVLAEGDRGSRTRVASVPLALLEQMAGDHSAAAPVVTLSLQLWFVESDAAKPREPPGGDSAKP